MCNCAFDTGPKTVATIWDEHESYCEDLESFFDLPGFDGPFPNEETGSVSTTATPHTAAAYQVEERCEHVFREHWGLSQKFQYCVKCDLKKED